MFLQWWIGIADCCGVTTVFRHHAVVTYDFTWICLRTTRAANFASDDENRETVQVVKQSSFIDD
jgi:hypothetical protein